MERASQLWSITPIRSFKNPSANIKRNNRRLFNKQKLTDLLDNPVITYFVISMLLIALCKPANKSDQMQNERPPRISWRTTEDRVAHI